MKGQITLQSPHFNFFNEVHVFHCHTNEKIPIVIIDSNIVTAGFMRVILRDFIVTPKNVSEKARREGGMRFFWETHLFNLRSDGFDPGNKTQTKKHPQGMPFCLELLAGLEPATC